jgi:hypothetical protein
MLSVVLLLLLAGCKSIPSGQVAGPIVPPPKKTDTFLTADKAVNYMLTSLVMKCRPIADAGKQKPKIINDFVFSFKQVNYLQMDVWRKLTNMNMISPETQISEGPEYRLVSEIKRMVVRDDGSSKYLWKMNLNSVPGQREIWKEEVEFVK